MAEQKVTLNPGESQIVTFEAVPQKAKTYQVSVDGLSGSFTAITEKITTVTVYLKNAPGGCEWQLIVYDWNETAHISKFRLGCDEPAVYNIPSGWVFPLKVDILIYNPATFTEYYRMHSTPDHFPQFHKDIFIPDYGSYYFNVTTEQFEPR